MKPVSSQNGLLVLVGLTFSLRIASSIPTATINCNKRSSAYISDTSLAKPGQTKTKDNLQPPNADSIQHQIAQAIYFDGLVKMNYGQYIEAASRFHRTLQMEPTCLEPWIRLGTMFHAAGDLGQAKRMFRSGSKSKPCMDVDMNNSSVVNPSLGFICQILVSESYQRRIDLQQFKKTKSAKDMTILWRWRWQGPPPHLNRPPNSDEEEMMNVCREAAELDKMNPEQLQMAATAFELLEFTEEAIQWLNSTLKLYQSKLVNATEAVANEIMPQIAKLRGKMEQMYQEMFGANMYAYEDRLVAIHAMEKLVEIDPTSWTHRFNLALIYCYARPWDRIVTLSYNLADDMAIEDIEEFRERTFRAQYPNHPYNRRKSLHTFFNLSTVTVRDLQQNEVWKWSPGAVYQLAQPLCGDFIYTNEIGDKIPTRFNERYIFTAEIEEVTMEGKSGVLYTNEYVWAGNKGSRPADYTDGLVISGQSTVKINEPVLSIGSHNMASYYHFLAEGMSRWALATELFMPLYPEVKLLIPKRNFVEQQVIDLLKMDPRKYILYDPQADPDSHVRSGNQTYHFKKLHVLDWELPPFLANPVADAFNETWKQYQPPRIGIRMARKMLVDAYKKRPDLSAWPDSTREWKPPKVVYASRADARFIRHVRFERALLPELEKVLGCIPLRIVVHNRDKTVEADNNYALRWETSKYGTTSLTDQMRYFAETDLLIGPHGAGLTNAMFAKVGNGSADPGATLMVFPTRPQVDNCFVNIAAALDQQFYVVDSISAYYIGPYNSPIGETPKNQILHAQYVLKQILKKRGWDRYTHFCERKCSSAEPWSKFPPYNPYSYGELF